VGEGETRDQGLGAIEESLDLVELERDRSDVPVAVPGSAHRS
jgi:hypothetical protein